VAGVTWTGGASATTRSSRARRAALAEVLVAVGEQVEGDEAGRGLGRELGDAAGGGVDPQRQEVEVEPVGRGDHELAVDDGARGQRGLERLDDLGEVAVQRPLVAAAELDLVAVPEDDAAEPVPLWLVRVAGPVRQLAGKGGQHR
jgi:hypothetical protein